MDVRLNEAAAALAASEGRRWAYVEHALGQFERGEVLSEEEMDRRVERMLAQPCNQDG